MLNSLALKALGIGLACALFLGMVYFAGYNSARHAGRAEYLALQVEYAEEQRKASDAYGKALALGLEAYQQEVDYAQSLEMRLVSANALAQQKKSAFEKEISLVTKHSNHVFSVDFIRLYNKVVSSSALPAASDPR